MNLHVLSTSLRLFSSRSLFTCYNNQQERGKMNSIFLLSLANLDNKENDLWYACTQKFYRMITSTSFSLSLWLTSDWKHMNAFLIDYTIITFSSLNMIALLLDRKCHFSLLFFNWSRGKFLSNIDQLWIRSIERSPIGSKYSRWKRNRHSIMYVESRKKWRRNQVLVFISLSLSFPLDKNRRIQLMQVTEKTKYF